MTNTKELKVEMLKHGDTGATLSKYLKITSPTFSHKLNNISEFTQEEIFLIKNKYNLDCSRIDFIFFAK